MRKNIQKKNLNLMKSGKAPRHPEVDVPMEQMIIYIDIDVMM